MHRASAGPNPAAPLAHHHLDATHISHGVVNAAVALGEMTYEVSAFHGRESDEHRVKLEIGPLDSYAGRISWKRGNWRAQFSAGHLKFPDPTEFTDVDRVTASAAFVARSGRVGLWATTVAYGANASWIVLPDSAVRRVSQALLLETTLGVDRRNVWFGLFELVGKPGHDLHLHSDPARILPTAKLQAGYVRDLGVRGPLAIGVGGSAAVSVIPAELVARYDGRLAPSAAVFVVLRPRHRM